LQVLLAAGSLLTFKNMRMGMRLKTFDPFDTDFREPYLKNIHPLLGSAGRKRLLYLLILKMGGPFKKSSVGFFFPLLRRRTGETFVPFDTGSGP